MARGRPTELASRRLHRTLNTPGPFLRGMLVFLLIVELERQIPKEISWALQVDGHTDARPNASSAFPSNWELSSARATSVVKYLISRGVPPNRLVAAGYGEFAPLEEGTSDEVLRRNRRIELKLTNR